MSAQDVDWHVVGPRLLEALEDLVDVQIFATGWDNGVTDSTGTMNEGAHFHNLSMDRARSAIAAAKGETT